MSDKAVEGFCPTHRMFLSTMTGFPEVVIDDDPRLGKPVPSIQWDGVAFHGGKELSMPAGRQLLFGLMIDADDCRWHYFERDDAHRDFRVAFLGKLKDFPDQEAGLRFASTSSIKPEDYVAVLSSGRVIVPETLGPSTFLVQVILLADEGGVVIAPKPFVKLEVLAEQVEISRQELSKRAEEQGMDY